MSKVNAYETTAGVVRIAQSSFAGFLLKTADGTILDKFIQADKYVTTPDQRQDSDSYRDGYGELHRTVLSNVVTDLKITTVPMTLEEKLCFFDAIYSGLEEKAERKVTLTYWNDETHDYCTDTFYIPDIKFTIHHYDDKTIYYDAAEIEFIGYGEEREDEDSE
ncbi:MAG: hypothetical protein LUD27_00670 [Clostridia bacterium]|nr:hypothetical protein [Clostridia bacterium]